MIQNLIAVVLFAASIATPSGSWHSHYENAVRMIGQGKGAGARAELTAAYALRSKEGLQLAGNPGEYLDYLPHLYMAIADQMIGDVTEARKELALAETSGLAAKSEVGRPLLVAYELLLRGDATGKQSRPSYAIYSKKTPVLSESDFSTLRNDVLTRCNLPPDSKIADAPWYARYELGLRLEQKGDYPRALAELVDAVSQRPNPQRRARTYGMWLIDYYPYFHIARSHMRLENWECARNALDISQKLGEIPPEAPEMNEYLSLQREVEKRLASK